MYMQSAINNMNRGLYYNGKLPIRSDTISVQNRIKHVPGQNMCSSFQFSTFVQSREFHISIFIYRQSSVINTY